MPENIFDIKNINNLYNSFLNLNKKINDSQKIKKLFNNFNNPLYSKLKDSEFNYDLLDKRFIHLDGYWQNISNIIDAKSFLINSLTKIPNLKEAFQGKPEKKSTMLIVRRGDYLNMGEDLGVSFYEECLNYMKKEIGDIDLNIFTDDIEWVKNNKLFINANNIYGPKEDPKGVIELFSKMINHENFIVSNSSFSLIAALLNEGKDSTVLVADPWFRKKDKGKMYLDHWIKIKNSNL